MLYIEADLQQSPHGGHVVSQGFLVLRLALRVVLAVALLGNLLRKQLGLLRDIQPIPIRTNATM